MCKTNNDGYGDAYYCICLFVCLFVRLDTHVILAGVRSGVVCDRIPPNVSHLGCGGESIFEELRDMDNFVANLFFVVNQTNSKRRQQTVSIKEVRYEGDGRAMDGLWTGNRK